MKTNINKIFFISFVLFLFIFTNSFAYNFNQNLLLGSSNEDVRQLQIFLNNYSAETKIANSGVGSPGYETTYFGLLTKQALIKFQNINANSILIPNGLSSGTGYFGPSTRNFINSLSGSNNISTPINSNIPNINVNEPIYNDFMMVSKNNVKNGDKVYLGSNTILKDLDFYINNKKLDKSCRGEYICEIKIETSTNGINLITTNVTTLRPAEINVIDEDEKKPVVKISNIKINEENEITGKYLSDKIKVYTMLGIFEVTTEDNKFKLNIETAEGQFIKNLVGPFYVENENGLTSDIIIITYEI
jgi:peptidoglycan hydrolase-like protein with peptidoglycan-binding domain